MRFRKSKTDTAEAVRAQPLVGSTWLGPRTKLPSVIGVCSPSRISPALFEAAEIGEGFVRQDSRCSGAYSLTKAMASSSSRARTMPPMGPPSTVEEKADALLAHLFPVAGNGGKRLLGDAAAPGDEIGGAVGAVLGLDQQVETGERAVGGVVGEHDHFARPGGRAGVDDMRDKALRGGDPGLPGPTTLATFGMVCVP